MKNDYNQKKRITIILLAVVAVCLAGGLFWYMGTLGSTQPPVALAENQTETEPTVTIPESSQIEHPSRKQYPSQRQQPNRRHPLNRRQQANQKQQPGKRKKAAVPQEP